MDDFSKISLKTLAWKNHGDFPFDCSKCTGREKEIRNCDMKENHSFTLQDEEFILTTCPINYLLDSHTPFIDKYYYLQEFPGSALSYENTNALFWSMYSIYKSEASKHDIEKMKELNKQNNK